jgi:NADH dehydrogenase
MKTKSIDKPAFLDFREVLVTGGTGFLGERVLRALVARGWSPRILTRDGSVDRLPSDIRSRCRVTPGDVTDPDSVLNAAQSTDAVVHLAGIIRENPERGVRFERVHVLGTENVIAAAKYWGIRRLVHVSVLGADPASPDGFLSSKGEGERRVRTSGLDWTVIRPAVIFGEWDRFLTSLKDAVGNHRFLPVPGSGAVQLQPVWVGDVARGVAEALDRPGTIGRSFDAAGPEVFRYDELLDRVGASLGREGVHKLHVPAATARRWVGILSRFEAFPLSPSMLEVLLLGATCDPAPFAEAFGGRMVRLSEFLSCTAGKSAERDRNGEIRRVA